MKNKGVRTIKLIILAIITICTRRKTQIGDIDHRSQISLPLGYGGKTDNKSYQNYSFQTSDMHSGYITPIISKLRAARFKIFEMRMNIYNSQLLIPSGLKLIQQVARYLMWFARFT